MSEAVHDFLVPDLGEGLADATVTEWHVQVGDRVELNQPLCTVETNKAQVEIPSPYAGRIVELGGREGDTLDVGVLLVRIAEPGAAPPDPARRPVLVGYGADDAMDSSRRRPGTRRPRAAPRTRKLAAELGVDLTHVNGSEPDKVISRAQVLAAAGEREPRASLTGVQAAMAQRMALSRRDIPDAHVRVQADCTALLRLRDELREKVGGTTDDATDDATDGAEDCAKDGATDDATDCATVDRVAITPFVLIVKLMVVALRRHRQLNATWVDGAAGAQIHLHSSVHVGFGVATPRGLLVPVVRDAQRLSTRELARAVSRLTAQARAGTVKPVDLHGSTVTVSNFGALDIDDGVPVINPPEAAIVGIGSIKTRPVVVDGAVVPRATAAVTCAFDHRVADGAQAAGFLAELRDLIESPELALLDL